MPSLPSRARTTVCFAHPAYAMQDRFERRSSGLSSFQVRSPEELRARIAEADVVCVSGLWRNELLAAAPRLAFVQSISAGTDQYSREAFVEAGVRLASAQGVNEQAVSQHAMALILARSRHLIEARDNQLARHWRPMIAAVNAREEELGGKTLVIVGMGRIGSLLAGLGRAFGMHVIGVKRDPTRGAEAADEAIPQARLAEALARADFAVLTCPLTPETEGLINAAALQAMKPTAYLVNVARGKVVVEADLIAALAAGRIAGAAIDTAVEEPLPAASPLWTTPRLFITPHSAGETQRYEDNVIDLMMENLERLWAGRNDLKNGIA